MRNKSVVIITLVIITLVIITLLGRHHHLVVINVIPILINIIIFTKH